MLGRTEVRLDLAWVHYRNRDSFNTPFANLDFGGILIMPMLQVRL